MHVNIDVYVIGYLNRCIQLCSCRHKRHAFLLKGFLPGVEFIELRTQSFDLLVSISNLPKFHRKSGHLSINTFSVNILCLKFSDNLISKTPTTTFNKYS